MSQGEYNLGVPCLKGPRTEGWNNMKIYNRHLETKNVELWIIMASEQIVWTAKGKAFNEQFIKSLVILRHHFIGLV